MIAIGIAMGFGAQAISGLPVAHLAREALLALAMIPVMVGPFGIFPLNPPQWSLLMELFANSAHAALLRHFSPRVLVMTAAVCAALTALAAWHFGRLAFGAGTHDWLLAVPRVLFSYIVGMIFAQTSRRLLVASDWLLAAIVPVVAVVMLPCLPGPVWIGDALMVIVVLPMSFALLLSARPPATAERWLRGLGRLSFPLYAIQMPVIWLCSRGTGHDAILATACALVGAHVIGVAGERRWLGRLIAPHRPLRLATA